MSVMEFVPGANSGGCTYTQPPVSPTGNNKPLPQNYMPVVYICSPYAGNVKENVRKARNYCRYAVEQGCIPVAPHLFFPQFLDDNDTDERELAMRMNRILVKRCQELWVFGTRISDGMMQEIATARNKNKPIQYFTTICEEEM